MKSILAKIVHAVCGDEAKSSADRWRRLWEEAAASAYAHVVALQELRDKLTKSEEKAVYWERRWGEAGKDHEDYLALFGKFQNEVRAALLRAVGEEYADQIDGSGSDGDAFEFTMAEIGQGLTILEELKEVQEKAVRLVRAEKDTVCDARDRWREKAAKLQRAWTETLIKNGMTSKEARKLISSCNIQDELKAFIDEYAPDENPGVVSDADTKGADVECGEPAILAIPEAPKMIHLELKMPPDLGPSPESVGQQALEDEFWAETEAAELNDIEPTNVVEVVYQLETAQDLHPIVRAMQVEGMDQQNLDLWRLDPANTLAAQELISEAAARLARRGKEWFQEQNCYRFFVTRIAGISTWGGTLDNCVVIDEYFAEKENGEY